MAFEDKLERPGNSPTRWWADIDQLSAQQCPSRTQTGRKADRSSDANRRKPHVNPGAPTRSPFGPQTIAEALESNAFDTLIVLDPTGNQQLDELELHGTIGAVVGPEGGFTADELGALNDAGAHCVRLGHLVLRTETAAPVAAALVLHRLGHI